MSDTPITDSAKFNWMHSHPAMNANQDVVQVETARQLERMCAELATRLNNARDDVNEAVNDHINKYGTNYPSKNARLEALKAEVAAVDAALARWQAMKDQK